MKKYEVKLKKKNLKYKDQDDILTFFFLSLFIIIITFGFGSKVEWWFDPSQNQNPTCESIYLKPLCESGGMREYMLGREFASGGLKIHFFFLSIYLIWHHGCELWNSKIRVNNVLISWATYVLAKIKFTRKKESNCFLRFCYVL